jgi:hypothetical protein
MSAGGSSTASSNASSAMVRRINFRMAIPDIAGTVIVYPVLQILVDGEEVLARPYSQFGAYIASPPAALLEDGAPLLPTRPARRVALYIDSSSDPRGGCLAPVISSQGDLVTWSDFRIFVAAEDAPIISESADQGSNVAVPDMAFDAELYTREVMRVTGEREWESDPWQTALLLDNNLAGQGLGRGVWELGWVEPEPGGRFVVTLWDEDVATSLKVVLSPGPGRREQRARSMATYLLETPPERWPVVQ